MSLAYRRAGASGLDLSAFSLGLWQKFGTDYAFESQRAIVLNAFELGISHFDNADRYGPPHRAAQQFFGEILRRDLGGHRDELILSTKAGNPIGASPYLQGGSRKSLLGSLDHSLRDLGTDYVDIFYHHRADESVPLDETVGALVSAVQQGKALYVGISNYPAPRAQEIAALLRAAGVPLLVHQPRYSIFDRTPEESGLIKAAAADGFGLVVYSPLAQLALQWVLREPQVTSALIGASSPEQLDHNVQALEFPPLTDDELAAIDGAAQ